MPIVCTALLATAALFFLGSSCGHDFDFHLLSWMEVARAWHAGLVSPHWVQDANFGAGEPRLIFYPPASWLLGAALGVVTSWQLAPTLFVLLALIAAGCSMYLLAREWTSKPAASFAACLYVANPYAMFVAYERGALGELLAAAWLPLMVLFALRKRSSVAPLGLAVAALWLTNSPAAVIGSYLLAVLALAMSIAERKAWPALRAAGGIALGLALASFYIVPAAFEQRWVQIHRAIGPGMRVEDSFLFAHTANAFHNQVLRTASWIFVAEFAGAVFFAWLAWRTGNVELTTEPGPTPVKDHRRLLGRREFAGRTALMALMAALPLILLLQLPFSNLLWKIAPHMKFLQFPWRWLTALSMVGCALAGMAFPTGLFASSGIFSLIRHKASAGDAAPALASQQTSPVRRGMWFVIIAGVVISTMAISGGFFFFQPCDEEDAVAPQVAAFQTGEGVVGTDEYTPVGADNASVQQDLPLVRVLRNAQDDTADSTDGENPEWKAGANGSIRSTFRVKQQNGEHWVVDLMSAEPGYAVLRRMDYPSWRVRVDGVLISQRPARLDGLMTVPVRAGRNVLDVQWITTPDVWVGRSISFIALLVLGLVTAAEVRSRRAPRV